MIKSLSMALSMINQEGGAMPGEGLTALETFTYFFAAPVLIFIVISVIVWFATAPKKAKSDVVTRIDDDNDNSITVIS